MPNIYGNSEIWGDLLVTGSFSILGSASSIYTTSLVVSDTIISLGHSQSGSPILDEGIMFTRGTGLTQAFIWDESDDTFALINTNDDHTVIGDVNILGYSNLRLGGLTTSTIKISNGAASGYLLQSDASGNATWVSATSSSANFANTDLTLTSNRTHELSGWDLVIGQGVSQTIGMYNGFSTQITYQNSIWEIASNYQQFDVAGTNSLTLFTTEAVFNNNGANYDFRVEGDTEPNLFFVDASTDRIGIGTASPSSKLNLIGGSVFRTSTLTTGTTASFVFLDGTSTATDTTNVKSIYKEFRPTTTSSSTVIGDGTLIYPNISSSSSAEYYASANLALFTGNLSNLSSNEAITGEVNVISIYSNTGTYNGTVKSSSAVLENSISGGTIDKWIGYWANGLSGDITHNGTTNKIYGFYMDDQSTRSGNIPSTSNRWGIYIADGGNNYFAGKVGIGVSTPSYGLEVSGTVSTTGFRMTDGATNGYVLTSDASGVASWQSLPSGVSVYSSTQSFTGGVTYSINHALSTDNILVNVWDESSGELIYVKATKTSANNVDLNSTVTLASGRIVIMGG